MPYAAVVPASRHPLDVLRSAACFVLSAVCLVQAYAVVFVLRIGPVIGVIDARDGRGVHEGDLLAVPLGLAALLLAVQGWSRVVPRSPLAARGSLAR